MPTYYSAAKINLLLSIGAKKADGYHALTSIMQSVAFFDRLDIEFGKERFSLASTGGDLGPVENNIITRSWNLLKETYGLPGEIAVKLNKRLPVGAGLAGGTGNGAAVFRAVADRFSLDLAERYDLARIIGSDLPFCLEGGTALVEGTGERVMPLPALPRRHLLLANPGFPVSTKEIFAAYDQAAAKELKDHSAFIAQAKAGEWQALSAHLYNDLQAIAFHAYPRLRKVYEWFLNHGLLPLMSGSGPSIFAFIGDSAEAEKCAASLPEDLGRAWVLSTTEKGVYHEREIIAG